MVSMICYPLSSSIKIQFSHIHIDDLSATFIYLITSFLLDGVLYLKKLGVGNFLWVISGAFPYFD